MKIDVIVRCRNEMPWATSALDALFSQRGVEPRVIVYECGSTDGSRECAVERGAIVRDVDPAKYVPGAVLNRAMRESESALVAFVNADAIALSDDALARLSAPFASDPRVAATFGRQLARPSADASARADTERAFGERSAGRVRHGQFFSMAASMVRRSWWERLPFDEQIRYSEDVDWTRRVSALGAHVEYVPEARFEHSHNYDLRAQFRRRRGEGAADTQIFGLGAVSLLREGLRPLAGTILRDLREGRLHPYDLATRVAQASGYLVGRARGFQR